MKEAIRLIWRCKKCKDVVISYSHLRHEMNYCECGESAIDLEEHYQRTLGDGVEDISRKVNKDGVWANIPLKKKKNK